MTAILEPTPPSAEPLLVAAPALTRAEVAAPDGPLPDISRAGGPALVVGAARTRAVAVVVPAHNEQDRIGACVAGVRRAAAHPDLVGVRVHLVVVLDDCHDATGEMAAAALAMPGSPLTAMIVSVDARNVGRARAVGAIKAFLAAGAVDPEQVWLATTDADSVVPDDWLAHHLELRRGGAEGCAGTVVVDTWREHPATAEHAFEAHYRPGGHLGFGHPHVHGTNLGVSMAAYIDAGGFPPVATGEDHALWHALAAGGRRLVATAVAPVTTSGRRHGRSPAGFADTLVRLGSGPLKDGGKGEQDPCATLPVHRLAGSPTRHRPHRPTPQ